LTLKIHETELPDILLIEPVVHGDDRGFFFESFHADRFSDATGVGAEFVQDNHSRSARGVLRGIHYQITKPQGKLVRALAGEVLDVAVDLRKGSPNFGQHVTRRLSAENKLQLWIPPGFGHAFLALSEFAEIAYKTTEYWYGEYDRSIIWNDESIGIDWEISDPTLSGKDQKAPRLIEAELFD
jgi:dTDP-4-dehydrorhamnose 3,5-epimerase